MSSWWKQLASALRHWILHRLVSILVLYVYNVFVSTRNPTQSEIRSCPTRIVPFLLSTYLSIDRHVGIFISSFRAQCTECFFTYTPTGHHTVKRHGWLRIKISRDNTRNPRRESVHLLHHTHILQRNIGVDNPD